MAASVKERRKLKGIPRKANDRRRTRKYAAYRLRVGKPNGPGQPGNKKGKGRLRGPSCVWQKDVLEFLSRPAGPEDAVYEVRILYGAPGM
jgi:hypothetical protein